MSRGWRIFCLPFVSLLLFGFTVEHRLDNVQQEQRAKKLFTMIHCMVCEGQPIAESQTELAISMRALIRDFIAQGKRDEEILDFMRQRYGQKSVLLPAFTSATLWLWLAPLLFVLAGIAGLLFLMKQTKH